MPLEDLLILTPHTPGKTKMELTKPTTEKLFSRIRSNIGSISSRRHESSFRVYYPAAADAAISVPFTWESQPGTPKHHTVEYSSRCSNLPPLTPPPSFYASHKSSPLLEQNKLITRQAPLIFRLSGGSNSKLKILNLRGFLLGQKRSSSSSSLSHVTPTSGSGSGCYYSSSSSSSGSEMTSLSVSSHDSPPSTVRRWPTSRRSRWVMTTTTTSSQLGNNSNSNKYPLHQTEEEEEEDDEEEEDARAAVKGGSKYFKCFGRHSRRSKSCQQFSRSNTNRALDFLV